MNRDVLDYSRGERTMGSATTDILLLGGVALVAYFVLNKLGLFSSGGGAGIDPQQTTQQQTSSLQQAIQTAQTNGQTGATMTDANYQSIANSIYTLATSVNTNPLPQDLQLQIQNLVIQANTQVDILGIVAAFGVKKANCIAFGLGCTTYDLPSFLRAALDVTTIDTINSYLSSQNINYQF